MTVQKSFLSVPKEKSVRYERNFIALAVCELRFPTLLELEAKPPVAIQAKLRKGYPFYEAQVLETGGSDGLSREVRYLFRSKEQKWTVTLRSFSLALETSAYVDFEDFYPRMLDVLDKSKAHLDTDFLTRVGLRYINAIPIEDGKLEGWICPDLAGSLTKGVFGSVDRFQGAVQGYTELGQFTFRHGTKHNDFSDEENQRKYYLDFDYFAENVEVSRVPELLKGFHETNFSFFHWCLGEKAKALLGASTPKKT